MSDEESDPQVCPLCVEEMDLSDRNFLPCPCGYKICMWCWHHIRENLNGLCPACRTPYTADPYAFAAVDRTEIVRKNKERKQKERTDKKIEAITPNSSVTPTPGNPSLPITNLANKPSSTTTTASAAILDRRHLHNFRVIQRNLVYVIGIPVATATEELFRKAEYFGQYGKITKVVIHRNHTSTHPTVSAYVSFSYKEDAKAAIQALDGFRMENYTLKASFGTTKYCNNFIRGVACGNPECVYLHELGDDDDRFTKEEIQAGHSKLNQVPGKDQSLVTGNGGPSGTGKRLTAEPVLPQPVFIQDNSAPSIANIQANNNDGNTATSKVSNLNAVRASSGWIPGSTNIVNGTYYEPEKNIPDIEIISEDINYTENCYSGYQNSFKNPSESFEIKSADMMDPVQNDLDKKKAFGHETSSNLPPTSQPATSSSNIRSGISGLSSIVASLTSTERKKSFAAQVANSKSAAANNAHQNSTNHTTSNDNSVSNPYSTNSVNILPLKNSNNSEKTTTDSKDTQVGHQLQSSSTLQSSETSFVPATPQSNVNQTDSAKYTALQKLSPNASQTNSSEDFLTYNQPTAADRPSNLPPLSKSTNGFNRVELLPLPQFRYSFNGIGQNTVFPVPVSSLQVSIWSPILQVNTHSNILEPFPSFDNVDWNPDRNPFESLSIPFCELFDLTLPPVDAIGYSPWPKPHTYYFNGNRNFSINKALDQETGGSMTTTENGKNIAAGVQFTPGLSTLSRTYNNASDVNNKSTSVSNMTTVINDASNFDMVSVQSSTSTISTTSYSIHKISTPILANINSFSTGHFTQNGSDHYPGSSSHNMLYSDTASNGSISTSMSNKSKLLNDGSLYTNGDMHAVKGNASFHPIGSDAVPMYHHNQHGNTVNPSNNANQNIPNYSNLNHPHLNRTSNPANITVLRQIFPGVNLNLGVPQSTNSNPNSNVLPTIVASK